MKPMIHLLLFIAVPLGMLNRVWFFVLGQGWWNKSYLIYPMRQKELRHNLIAVDITSNNGDNIGNIGGQEGGQVFLVNYYNTRAA